MQKKVLMPVVILLVLFAVAPVMAAPATQTPYEATVSLTITYPGEEKITAGGIKQVKGVEASGLFVADLPLTGTMWKDFDFTVNTVTGKGTLHGKFILEVDTAGTLVGTFMGIITGGVNLAGTVVGHGTGAFEGYKTMGTWEGTVDFGLSTIVNTLDAILLVPRG